MQRRISKFHSINASKRHGSLLSDDMTFEGGQNFTYEGNETNDEKPEIPYIYDPETGTSRTPIIG